MDIYSTLKPGLSVLIYQLSDATDSLIDGKIEKLERGQIWLSLPPNRLTLNPNRLVEREIILRWQTGGMRHECPTFVEEVDGNILRLKPSANDRREFLRLVINLPLVFELIPEEEIEEYNSQVLDGQTMWGELDIETERFWRSDDIGEQLDDQFSQLAKILQGLDSKLDYLIGLQEGKPALTPGSHKVSLLDISGTGLCFTNEKPLPTNTCLKLKIEMSRFPLSEVHAIGRVVRSVPMQGTANAGQFEVGVLFETMREDHREKIFRFISRTERRMLRERKEAQQSG